MAVSDNGSAGQSITFRFMRGVEEGFNFYSLVLFEFFSPLCIFVFIKRKIKLLYTKKSTFSGHWTKIPKYNINTYHWVLSVCHTLRWWFMYIIRFFTVSEGGYSYQYYTDVPQNLHKITEVVSGRNNFKASALNYCDTRPQLLCYTSTAILQYYNIAIFWQLWSQIPILGDQDRGVFSVTTSGWKTSVTWHKVNKIWEVWVPVFSFPS